MAQATGSRVKRCGGCWSDLPEELLRDVIDCLPGLGDRLRFRAVCTSWRRAERAHAPPRRMPWLAASGSGYCVSLHDAAIHRIPLPDDDARAAACRGSLGNWLVMVPPAPDDDAATVVRPFLLNPFTKARIDLPTWTSSSCGGTITKVILSSPPDSDDCTVAAIAGCEFGGEVPWASIAVCRLKTRGGSSCSSWWRITEAFTLQDIAFFDGNIHAVDAGARTHVFEDEKLGQMRAWPLRRRPAAAPLCGRNRYYLVPCCHGSRLLMVRRSFAETRVPGGGGGGYRTVGFEVSAVTALLPEQRYDRWAGPPPPVPATSFHGHALFVGDACCGAFPVGRSSGDRIREDQILYTDDESNYNIIHDHVDDDTSTGGLNNLLRRTPLRSLQSYDKRTDCFRRYQPPSTQEAGGARTMTAAAWQCVALQRLLHREALPPPPATQRGAKLLLWELMSSLGASRAPCYTRSQGPAAAAAGTHAMDVSVHVYDQSWRFTGTGRLEQEAAQEVAREAVTFLRSRYRSVLDDSPWSSIPHYHSHVSEEDEDEDEEPSLAG